MAKYRVGIDVGGTFTDVVAIDEESGAILSSKTPTTPEDQSKGVIEALRLTGIPARDISFLAHGFTVGINAVLTRTGAKTGLLCTAGHCDLLDVGRLYRPFGESLYDPHWVRPHQERPLVERRYVRGIRERIDYRGETLLPLNEAQTREEVEFLKREGVQSIAICFINSYIDQRHEQRVRQIVQEVFPNAYVQTSVVSPVAKEYERTMTVVIDAYVGPKVHSYLDRLEQALKQEGYEGDVLIMQIMGGSRVLQFARETPVYALSSGPVGGCLGSRVYGEWLGIPDIITLDIGGTSTDAAVIRNGNPVVVSEQEVEPTIPILLPVVEVNSIGSGGGSVIHLDRAGALRIGPESVGAKPGPACYGFGGTAPAMTDAYVVMGVLQPQFFLGGRMPLNKELAFKAIRGVADMLKMGDQELSQAAFEIANVQCANAIRNITSYRGLDTREFSLFAFGSAGPMHACYIMKELLAKEAVVPLYPGGFCAFGLIATDMRVDYSESPMKIFDAFTPEEFEERFSKLEEQGVRDLEHQGFSRDKVKTERVYYGMYYGQTWDNRVPIKAGPYNAESMSRMKEEFHQRYLETYGYQAPELPILVTTLTASSVGAIPRPRLVEIKKGRTKPPAEALLIRVDVYMDRKLNKNVPFYDRTKLLAGNVIPGPAIVVEEMATTVVGSDFTLRVDQIGDLRITSK